MNVSIEPVSNGFVIKALDGENTNKYVTLREGKFTTDLLWARLFMKESDAEKYAKEHNWPILHSR